MTDCRQTRTGADARTRVIVAVTDSVSGVVSWALRLRSAFEGHERYRIILMACINAWEKKGRYDLLARTQEEARSHLLAAAPCIVVPNYIYGLCETCAELITLGHELRCVGFCRADSEREYYAPLSWYEPLFAQLVSVSPECAAELSRRLPGRAGDVTVLPTGVNVPQRLERPAQEGRLKIAYGGRILQCQKRVMDFVPLVGALREQGVHFLFELAGEGQELPALKKALRRPTESGEVRFLGKLLPEQMGTFWNSHDVFVQTSEFEGTSNSMLEAMARGCVPVVTAASSGIQGVIEDGVNGFVVPVGDMAAMARVIARLARDRGLLAKLGQAAHQTARRFSMEQYVERFAAVLDRVAAGPVRRWPQGRPIEPDFQVPGRLLSAGELVRKLRHRIDQLERRRSAWRRAWDRVLNRWPTRMLRRLAKLCLRRNADRPKANTWERQ